MPELDEIFYNAITADAGIMELTGGRIRSTSFEVPPTDADNTPLPYIIITDDPMQDEAGTKDDEWESDWDSVQAGIEIGAASPRKVKELRRMVRHAIAVYVSGMTENAPMLRSFSNEGISWDWEKPCYWDRLHYQCDIEVDSNG